MKNPKEGEIWEVTFGDVSKAESGVIVSIPALRHLPFRLVVPIRHWVEEHLEYAWMVLLNPSRKADLKAACAADAKQCRSYSIEHLARRVGRVTAEELRLIREAVALCLGVKVA